MFTFTFMVKDRAVEEWTVIHLTETHLKQALSKLEKMWGRTPHLYQLARVEEV